MTRPYRPSNGTEGMWFDSQWCEHCARDAAWRENVNNDPCEILNLTFALDINHPEYPKEWIKDDDGGNPRCTAHTEDPSCPTRCDKTIDMFGGQS